MYQVQAEGALDQVVQARVEGKAYVQDLLMEYCKMKKPGVLYDAHLLGTFQPRALGGVGELDDWVLNRAPNRP